jgi:hypothetical protein
MNLARAFRVAGRVAKVTRKALPDLAPMEVDG